MPDSSLLRDILVLFGLGVAVVLLFQRARVPTLVGFLVTGVLCGPHGFGLIGHVEDVEAIAEVGVILLLFTIGIEFSVQQLVRLRSFLLGGGALQVGLTMAAGHLAGRALGLSPSAALFAGMLLALSSTAIVLRHLADRGELDTPHGQASLAILIFQDLCVVPMMLATPLLAGARAEAGGLPGVLLRLALFAVAAVAAARWAFPWLLEQVVRTRKREVFLLAVIFLCLATAWATARIGLSLALGAFMAGLLISRSAYSHEALGEVLPLREVFNALFFVSIGMLFDVRAVLERPALVAAAIVGVLLLKSVIAAGVAFALGHSVRVAVMAGLALAQIGEFSFVLSRAGTAAGLLDARMEQLFLAVAVATMALTPALVGVAPRIADRIAARLPERWGAGRSVAHAAEPALEMVEDHVVIVGFGLNGRNLARVLGGAGIPFVVVEMNPDTVRAERAAGTPIIYGDATRPEILDYAGVRRARVLVVAISDAAATRSAVVLARRLNPGAHIVVRSRYVHEIDPLRALGTDEVVPEEYETSIEIFSRVLRQYLVPTDEIARLTREIRGTGYEALRTPGALPAATAGYERLVSGLAAELGRVEPGSALAGRTLRDGELRQRTGVSIVGIRRADGSTLANPSGDDVLEAGDVVLLLGEPTEIAAALPLLRAAPPPARDATLAPTTTGIAEP